MPTHLLPHPLGLILAPGVAHTPSATRTLYAANVGDSTLNPNLTLTLATLSLDLRQYATLIEALPTPLSLTLIGTLPEAHACIHLTW